MATWSERLRLANDALERARKLRASRTTTQETPVAEIAALESEALAAFRALARELGAGSDAIDVEIELTATAAARRGTTLVLAPSSFAATLDATRAQLGALLPAPAPAAEAPPERSVREPAPAPALSQDEVQRRLANAAARPTASTFRELAELVADYESLEAGASRDRARRSVQESFRALARSLVSSDRARFERFVLGTVLALAETDLLEGEPLAQCANEVLEGRAQGEPVKALLGAALPAPTPPTATSDGAEEPSAATPAPADAARLSSALDAALAGLASAVGATDAVGAARTARDAFVAAREVSPRAAESVRAAFDAAAKAALERGGPEALERVGRRFALAFDGTDALDGRALAAVARARVEAQPADDRDDETAALAEAPAPAAEHAVAPDLVERLLAQLEDAPDFAARFGSFGRDASSFLARLGIAGDTTGEPGALERFASSVGRLHDRLFRFDRRFKLLDALLGDWDQDGWDAFESRLGMASFADRPMMGLEGPNLGSLELVSAGDGGSSGAGFSAFPSFTLPGAYGGGDFSGGFGGYAPFQDFGSGSFGGGFMAPDVLAAMKASGALGGLGGMNPAAFLGKLGASQLAALVKSGALSLAGLKGVDLGSLRSALARSLGGGMGGGRLDLGSLRAFGALSGRGMGSFAHVLAGFASSGGGFGRFAMPSGGFRGPELSWLGSAQGLAQAAPRLGLMLPAMGRASFSFSMPSMPTSAVGGAFRHAFSGMSGLGGVDLGRLFANAPRFPEMPSGSFGGFRGLDGFRGFQAPRGESGWGGRLGGLESLGQFSFPSSFPQFGSMPRFDFSALGRGGSSLPSGLGQLGGGLPSGLDASALRLLQLGGQGRSGFSGLSLGAPTLGPLHGLSLDGFGRLRLDSFGQASSFFRGLTASLDLGSSFPPFGRLPSGSRGFEMPSFFGSGGLGLGGLGGLDRKGRLFPGSGLAWRGGSFDLSSFGGGSQLPSFRLPAGAGSLAPLALSRGPSWSLDGFGRMHPVGAASPAARFDSVLRALETGRGLDAIRTQLPSLAGLGSFGGASRAPSSALGSLPALPRGTDLGFGGRLGEILGQRLRLSGFDGSLPSFPGFASSPAWSDLLASLRLPSSGGSLGGGFRPGAGFGGLGGAPSLERGGSLRMPAVDAAFPGAGFDSRGLVPWMASGPARGALSLSGGRGGAVTGGAFGGGAFGGGAFSLGSLADVGLGLKAGEWSPAKAFEGRSLPSSIGAFGRPLQLPQLQLGDLVSTFLSQGSGLAAGSLAAIQPGAGGATFTMPSLRGLAVAQAAPTGSQPALAGAGFDLGALQQLAVPGMARRGFGRLGRQDPGLRSLLAFDAATPFGGEANALDAASLPLPIRALAALGLGGLGSLGGAATRLGRLEALEGFGMRPEQIAGFREQLLAAGGTLGSTDGVVTRGGALPNLGARGFEGALVQGWTPGFDLAPQLMGLHGGAAIAADRSSVFGLASERRARLDGAPLGQHPTSRDRASWHGAAAKQLGRPAASLGDAARLGPAALASLGARSALDLADGTGAPRVVPGLANGRFAGADESLRVGPGRARWQDLAQAQLDGREPVFAYRAGGDVGPRTGYTGVNVGDLVSPVSAAIVGSAPAMTRIQPAAVAEARREGAGRVPAIYPVGQPDSGFLSLLARTKGFGAPLPRDVQRRLTGVVGGDLSRVRVHADERADRFAQAVGAPAFAFGNDIYFQQGRFDPRSPKGLGTIAHEVSHAVRGHQMVQRLGDPTPGRAGDEKAADAAAKAATDPKKPETKGWQTTQSGRLLGFLPDHVRIAYEDEFGLDLSKDLVSVEGKRWGTSLRTGYEFSKGKLGIDVGHRLVELHGSMQNFDPNKLNLKLTFPELGQTVTASYGDQARRFDVGIRPNKDFGLSLSGVFWGDGQGAGAGVETKKVDFFARIPNFAPDQLVAGVKWKPQDGTSLTTQYDAGNRVASAVFAQTGQAGGYQLDAAVGNGQTVLGAQGQYKPLGLTASGRIPVGHPELAQGKLEVGTQALRFSTALEQGKVRAGLRFNLGADVGAEDALIGAVPGAAQGAAGAVGALVQSPGFETAKQVIQSDNVQKIKDAQKAFQRYQDRRKDARNWGVMLEGGVEQDPKTGQVSPWGKLKFQLAFKNDREAETLGLPAFGSPAFLSTGLGRALSTDAGSPLPQDARDRMQGYFGRDLSFVRLHDGPVAERGSRELKSEAFSMGRDVFIPRNRFQSADGFPLLAHELTHVMQSLTGAPGGGSPGPGTHGSAMQDPLEQQARMNERAFRGPKSSSARASALAKDLDMEHAQITPLKKSAQEHVDQLPTHTGSTETKVEASAVASPPDQDLNPLIYQLYARIKRELIIERERRSGMA